MATIPCPVQNFDFVRFTVADIHGIARGKSIPKRHVARFMEEGVELYSGKLVELGNVALYMLDVSHRI